MATFHVYLSLFWNFYSIPAEGFFIYAWYCTELCSVAQLCWTLCDPMDNSPPGSPDLSWLGRQILPTEPSWKPMHNTALCWSTDNSFPALAISWMSPSRSSGLAGLSLSVLYHIWSPCKACPTTHYSWSLPQGSWYFLINFPNHSHCHIILCAPSLVNIFSS